jgi:hypothetical protein
MFERIAFVFSRQDFIALHPRHCPAPVIVPYTSLRGEAEAIQQTEPYTSLRTAKQRSNPETLH